MYQGYRLLFDYIILHKELKKEVSKLLITNCPTLKIDRRKDSFTNFNLPSIVVYDVFVVLICFAPIK